MPMRPAPQSEARHYQGVVWRLAEDQSRPATMALADSLADQARLEELLDGAKPSLPPGCAHLHYLLSTPFRYRPHGYGSRWRRRGASHGCFYAAERVETAAIEKAFYSLLRFVEAPGLRLPTRPLGQHGFSATLGVQRLLDMTAPPFVAKAEAWTHPTDIGPCQEFAEEAVANGAQALRYRSVRDPEGGANIALMDCAGFAEPHPANPQSWWIFVRSDRVQISCDAPRVRIELPHTDFATDARIAAWLASRGA